MHTRLRMHKTRRFSPSGKCPSRNPRWDNYCLSRKRPVPFPPRYDRRLFIGQSTGGGAKKEEHMRAKQAHVHTHTIVAEGMAKTFAE